MCIPKQCVWLDLSRNTKLIQNPQNFKYSVKKTSQVVDFEIVYCCNVM